jgi:hypothetical protein
LRDRSGYSEQALTSRDSIRRASHDRDSSKISSDLEITSALSNLSFGGYNLAPGSLDTNTSYYQNYPYQSSGVDATTFEYAQSTSLTTINRPSDRELLQNVGREVELNPDADSTPPDFPLLSQGLWPRRILRGSERTHGTQERLKPSQSTNELCSLKSADRSEGFQIRRPDYRFFKRGVVFRVLWPELAGDVADNVSIVSDDAFDEHTPYKIRWFVVIREGYNCCTCL